MFFIIISNNSSYFFTAARLTPILAIAPFGNQIVNCCRKILDFFNALALRGGRFGNTVHQHHSLRNTIGYLAERALLNQFLANRAAKLNGISGRSSSLNPTFCAVSIVALN